ACCTPHGAHRKAHGQTPSPGDSVAKSHSCQSRQSTSPRWGAFPVAALVPIQPSGTKPPFFCVPGGGGNVIYLHALAYHLGLDQPFYGLQAQGLDGTTAPHTRVEAIAAYYIAAIQSVQPQGPYCLGGHSTGSWVALEMAHQLQAQGHRVAFIA